MRKSCRARIERCAGVLLCSISRSEYIFTSVQAILKFYCSTLFFFLGCILRNKSEDKPGSDFVVSVVYQDGRYYAIVLKESGDYARSAVSCLVT